MPRWYDVSFVNYKTNERVKIRQSGNTKNSARKGARGQLRRDRPKDHLDFEALRPVFIETT